MPATATRRPPKSAPPAHPVTQYALDVLAGKVLAGRPVRLACQRHLDDLASGAERGIRFDGELADRALAFFGYLQLAEGEHAGKPFVLQPWQQFIVGSLFGWVNEDGSRRFRTGYIEAGKGSGKALALDTPIPTPDGWTTMAALQPGDQVLDEQGSPCTVTAVTDVMQDRPCYRVGFDDGSEIVADAEHLWMTEARNGGDSTDRGASMRGVPLAERGGWRKGLRTTAEIARTLRYANGQYQSANHSVALSGPLDLPDAELPIDPYLLGAWLGDGDSDGARMTIGEQDAPCMIVQLESRGAVLSPQRSTRYGVRLSEKRWAPDSLNVKLRAAHLLHDKHIPAIYQRGSVSQRLALLQGLMDTDGHISPRTGVCEFTTTRQALAEGVYELVASLGVKATVLQGVATLAGREVSPKWRVCFSPPSDLPVFALPRKREQQRVRHERRRLSGERRIIACEPIPSVPVKCISVDSASHMYLCGRSMIPTHNSPMAAGIGLYLLVADGEASAEVYAAAVTRDQAKISFRDAQRMVEQSAALKRRVNVLVNNLSHDQSGSYFRPVSSEGRGLDGKRVHGAVIDEIHEHPTSVVVDKMRAGTKGRRQALIIEITNSGYDRQSVCFQHHQYSLQILDGVLHDDAWFAYVCQLDVCDAHRSEGKLNPTEGCPDCDDWHDEAVWEKANPNLDVTITRKYLRELVREATGMPAKSGIVMRLNFCIWTQQLTKWLPLDDWARGSTPFTRESLQGRRCFGGLDLARVHDLSAFALLFPPEADGERWKCILRFWCPEDDLAGRSQRDRVPYDLWARQGHLTPTAGNTTDFDYIEAAIVEDAAYFRMQEVAYDRAFADSLVQHLQDEHGLLMVPFGQGFLSMAAPTMELERMVRAGDLQHGGNPILDWCASNVVVRTDPAGNLKPDKEMSPERIDGIVALIMALGRAMVVPPEPESVYESRGLLVW